MCDHNLLVAGLEMADGDSASGVRGRGSEGGKDRVKRIGAVKSPSSHD